MRRASNTAVSRLAVREGKKALVAEDSACSPSSTPSAASPGEVVWREAHRHLAAIVEHSNDAIFSRTLDGTITTWNVAATRIFGYQAREIVGRRSALILPRGHQDEFNKLLVRMRRGEVVQHFETERLCKDGRCIHVSLTLSPIRDSDGRLIGFSTIARDITEQRRVREALERRERELNDLFEEASIGLLWTDPKGRILRANPALLGILECRSDECVGRTLARFHPDHTTLSALSERLARRETLRNFQTTFRAPNGRVKEVFVDANGFWERGKMIHARWFVRDITRRKQLEREVLAASERERRAFSRELHDSLGQQLSGIAYLSNVVRDRLAEQHSAEATEVARISKLLKQAIEETRRVSRGLSPVRPEPDGLSAALSEIVTHLRDVFRITCRFHRPKPVLIPDNEAATHLYRITQEAVNNAIRHGHARSITISLRLENGQIVLSIKDDGVGIATLSPKRKGLGLRVMQYRVGLLRGTLSVHRDPAGGTKVCCMVPLKSLRVGAPH